MAVNARNRQRFIAVCLLGTLLCLSLFVLSSCVEGADLAVLPATPNVVPTFTPTAVADPEDPTGQATSTVRPLTVALDPMVNEGYRSRLWPQLMEESSVQTAAGARPLVLLDRSEAADVVVRLVPLPALDGVKLMERFYAPVVPFETATDATTFEELAARWQGETGQVLVVPVQQMAELTVLFGRQMGNTVVMANEDAILTALEANPGSLGILPFDRLDPRYKVLTVDGANVLSNQLDASAYPLAVALSLQGAEAQAVAAILADEIQTAETNRHGDRLTTLIMTGVTAMSRVTAARMEARGYTYPALVISDTLRAADITHISNEVPFLDDCVVNASVNNLILCSHTNYWAALEALGTDIVGLSGNHVNDFGREGARRSIAWYRENEIPIYGGGMNVEEACAPLRWEHNGNTFAFIAALAFYPQSAWATEDQPGACYFYDHKDEILAMLEALSGEVDVVSIELQYLETYNPFPTAEQVREFREVREAGAEIVTGVQSHVPQAMEPYGPEEGRNASMIVYGLGNLFFDQMWSWQTRTELIARHTIYQGRLLSTEILTAVLEDYAQPRWTTAEERRILLQRIFAAAPERN